MQSGVVFSGDLEYLNLGELIQLIGSNGSSGILRIISKYVETPGLIYFKEGNPIDAKAGAINGQDALYSLFGWTEGDFEFVNEPVDVKQTIKKSRMEIILEGLRLLDDGNIEVKGAVTVDIDGKSADKDALALIKGPMIDYMDVVAEEEYQDGQPIVHEGKHGVWMWVVLEGKIKICKETPEGLIPLLKVGAGSFIGSLSSFSSEGYVRSATAVASDRVILGVLDRQRLSHEFSTLPADLRNILLSIDNRLKQVTDLALISKRKMLDTKKGIKDKKPIIKEGSDKQQLFSIRQGTAYIVKKMPQGELVLCELGKNDFVGRIPFLNIGHEPDSAAVYGTEDLEMDPIPIDPLVQHHGRMSGTMANMLENFSNFIAATTGIALNIEK
jgi:CRP-like cAMP-binding protein